MGGRLRLLLIALCLGMGLGLPGLALADPAFIYLVRHGEKAAGSDPALTAQGQQRARNIAALLRHAGIDTILSSPTQRTMQTALPLSRLASVTVQPYDPARPQDLVARIKAIEGGAVLVVGHSNTLPELVRLLGGAAGTDIGDEEYERVYQLSRGPDGQVRTVRLSSWP